MAHDTNGPAELKGMTTTCGGQSNPGEQGNELGVTRPGLWLWVAFEV